MKDGHFKGRWHTLDIPYVLTESWAAVQLRLDPKCGAFWASVWLLDLTIYMASNDERTAQNPLWNGSGSFLSRLSHSAETKNLEGWPAFPSPWRALDQWFRATLPWSMCIFTTAARSDLLLALRFRVSSACRTQASNQFHSQYHTAESSNFNFERNPLSLKRKKHYLLTNETCKYPCSTFWWRRTHLVKPL